MKLPLLLLRGVVLGALLELAAGEAWNITAIPNATEMEQAPQAFYGIVWTRVALGAAQLTKYVKTGNVDAATCSCDLNVGMCDVTSQGGCKCDNDCTKSESANFKSLLPDGTVQRSTNVCESSLVDANLGILDRSKASSKYQALGSEFLNDQLCIVAQNNPSTGVYYTDPGAIKDTVKSGKPATTLKNNKILVTMETSGARSEFSKYSFARTESLSPSFGASYEHGEPVALVGGKTSRYFSVPVQDWSGVCSSYNPAAFGINVGPSICTRTVSAPLSSATCEGFSASAHIVTVAATPTGGRGITPVTFVRGHRSTTDGLPHGYKDPSRNTLPETRYNLATKQCLNVLDSAHYTIQMLPDGEGQIKAVTVELWFKDTTETFIEQNFTVSFTKRDGDLGLPKSRVHLSGAPGYLVGLPLLAGVQQRREGGAAGVSSQLAIRERIGGLHVMGSTIDATCLGLSSAVRFKHDTVSTCTIALTEAQLTAACNAQELSASAAAETLFTQYSNESDTHLGVFGNADYAKLADWMEILPKAAVPAGNFNANLRTCQKLVTEYHLEIYTAPVGNQLSAQDKVVGAFYSYGTSHVQHQLDPATPQEIELRTTVSFIELPDKELVEKVKSIPKLPPLPKDLFYPFRVYL